MTWYWSYAFKPSNSCLERSPDMPWSTRDRLVQNKIKKNVFFVWKGVAIMDLIEGLWLVGTRFRY